MKPKKCRVCKSEFEPRRMGQKVCSPLCAAAFAKSERAKKERKDAIRQRRETREKLKTRADYMREAQAAFNAYIRLRDEGLPCICCGRYSTGQTRGGDWDAGHYRSRGAAPHLRFDERNCNAQLKKCNRYAAGNVVGYRAGLIERIGIEAVESLEADQVSRKWSKEDLIEIRDAYRAKRRDLMKRRDAQ